MKDQAKALLRRLVAASGLTERLDRLELRVAAVSGNAASQQELVDLELRVRTHGSWPMQRALAIQYQELAARGDAIPVLNDTEFRVYSQNGEDGILLYLFSMLGMGAKRSLELGGGDGIECNTANLVVHHGWHGMLIDGHPEFVPGARQFYLGVVGMNPPTLVNAFITAENVNELVSAHGFDGEIDLLSIDLDGVDYWIWKALQSVRPRVVVTEFQWAWGPDEAATVRYDPGFVYSPENGLYCGASLNAMTKLAREKGYRLVGCQRAGFNAFWVRDDLGHDVLPEVTPADCYDTMMTRRWDPRFVDLMRQLDYVEV